MKIGFDIDGVLADFIPSYQALFVSLTGRNTFMAGDVYNPPEWNWPSLRGYTEAETKAVWDAIRRNETFWLSLKPMTNNVEALRSVLVDLEHRHEVYYVSDRSGIDAKRQTKRWLMEQLQYHRAHTEPTVLLTGSGEKGHIARALRLDVFIDDKTENVQDIIDESPRTRVYFPATSYNSDVPRSIRVGRYTAVGALLDTEIAAGNL
jgi:uncharacterized HAD superfamily protein